MIELHDLFGPALADSPDPAAEFVAGPWDFYERHFLEPSDGLLEDYWKAYGDGQALRAVVESPRGFSVAAAIQRYRDLPEGTVARAAATAVAILGGPLREIGGTRPVEVWLVPGLFTANAIATALRGRTRVFICLEQNQGQDDLCIALTHELSHVALAASGEGGKAGGQTVGRLTYSEGLAVVSSMAALTSLRGGSPVGDADLAAAMWYPPDVLDWCRRNEARLWRIALPLLTSANGDDLRALFFKPVSGFWREDGTPYRAGYYLGHAAVAAALGRGLTLAEAHRRDEAAMLEALRERARRHLPEAPQAEGPPRESPSP